MGPTQPHQESSKIAEERFGIDLGFVEMDSWDFLQHIFGGIVITVS